MYKQFFQGMEFTWLPLFTLVLFLSIFLFVVARVFLVRRSSDFDAMAALPLREPGSLPSAARPEDAP